MDRRCAELFLNPGASERDDNLIFVRERLLKSGEDIAALLELYGQVWRSSACETARSSDGSPGVDPSSSRTGGIFSIIQPTVSR